MGKFMIGDRVRQIASGYNTSPHDKYKETTVIATDGNYAGEGGIKIDDHDWFHRSAGWRGEEAFELVQGEWD